MLKRRVRPLERVNAGEHLKRNHGKREPIRVAAEHFRVSIPDTLHQYRCRKRRRLITIDVDEEQLLEVGGDEKVHLVQIDEQDSAAVNVRHAGLQLSHEAQRELRREVVSLAKGFWEKLAE